MPQNEIMQNKEPMTLDEARYLFKKVGRALKTVTMDSEISGEINPDLMSKDLLPLSIEGLDDKYNLLGGMSISQFIASMDKSWEQDAMIKNRRYARYGKALEHPEIEGVLNIYADEAFTEDSEGNVLTIRHPDERIKEIIEDMFERLGLYDKGWEIIRNMCAYGDEYFEIIISQTTKRILKINWIPREYIKRVEKNGTLEGFEIDSDSIKGNQESTSTYQTIGLSYKTTQEKDNELIHPFRILHFKIPSRKYGVYGRSILDSVITTIESLQMMERAMMVARITRAAERRIYAVDVGTLQGDKAIAYARKAVSGMHSARKLSNFVNQATVDFQRDIFASTEDIIVPKRANTEGNSIDTLPQANNLGEIADLEYLRDKIFPGVGVLRQYLFDDSFANANLNLSSKSVPFGKRIKRVQRFFLYQMYKLATIELKLHKCSNEEINQLEILMNNPSTIDDQQRIELETARWTLVSTIKGLNAEGAVFYPDYKIYSDYLKLNPNEIVELLKLIYLQQANQNPFEAFDPEDRPEGADELLVGQPEMPGAEGGGEGETPIGPESGAPGAEGIPDEVTNTLETPPQGEEEVPENADVDHSNDSATTEYLEDKVSKRKSELLNKKKEIMKKFEKQIQEYVEHFAKNDDPKKYISANVVFEEQRISGEFRGFDKTISNLVDYNEAVIENRQENPVCLHRG